MRPAYVASAPASPRPCFIHAPTSELTRQDTTTHAIRELAITIALGLRFEDGSTIALDQLPGQSRTGDTAVAALRAS